MDGLFLEDSELLVCMANVFILNVHMSIMV